MQEVERPFGRARALAFQAGGIVLFIHWVAPSGVANPGRAERGAGNFVFMDRGRPRRPRSCRPQAPR
jgi:hypothetical protein